MTMRTPGTVSEVSAIEVASTTRRPSAGPQRAVLLGRRQVAMQRQDRGAAAVQRRLGAADFRHAGQEGENVARMLGQRGADGAGHGVRQVARHRRCRARRG